ncbi:MAG: hypothetical protein ACK4N5_04130, partial [Myxococcales bacterium]
MPPAAATQLQLRIDGPNGPIPVTEVRPAGVRDAPPVLVLHGLGASAEAQEKEVRSLAAHGFRALAVDAPHHGQRRDGFLERMQAAAPDASHGMLLQIVEQA